MKTTISKRRTVNEIRASIEAAAGNTIHFSILGYWWVQVRLTKGGVHQVAAKSLPRLERKVQQILDLQAA
jgi:hypothetical protein